MAKKKSDLEADVQHYCVHLKEMRQAHDQREHQKALGHAVAAWDYVDGMMQYERKYEDRTERKNLECVDYALRYAPLLFDLQTLHTLSFLLQTQKRIDKNTSADLAANLTQARDLMEQARQLWNHLESAIQIDHDKLSANFSGDQDRWRSLAEKWESMGLIQRVPNRGSYSLTLSTRLDSESRAKCSSCGVVAKAAKARFWEKITCPKCKANVYFVILIAEST